MKKNFMWWNVKINDYNEKIQAPKSEDVLKITKKQRINLNLLSNDLALINY